jgi:hypothetical protein
VTLKGNEKIKGEKPTKKAKNSKNMGTAASKKKVRAEQASNGATAMRALQSCTVRY